MHKIPTLSGDPIVVTPYCLRSSDYGPAGTFYKGDADLIADYLADPQGELDIHGIIHHINLRYSRNVFTLTIDFGGEVGSARFDHKSARELIFAMAGIQADQRNPHR